MFFGSAMSRHLELFAQGRCLWRRGVVLQGSRRREHYFDRLRFGMWVVFRLGVPGLVTDHNVLVPGWFSDQCVSSTCTKRLPVALGGSCSADDTCTGTATCSSTDYTCGGLDVACDVLNGSATGASLDCKIGRESVTRTRNSLEDAQQVI